MTVAQIAAWVLAVLVVGEAIALAVVVRQWRAAEHEADELRAKWKEMDRRWEKGLGTHGEEFRR